MCQLSLHLALDVPSSRGGEGGPWSQRSEGWRLDVAGVYEKYKNYTCVHSTKNYLKLNSKKTETADKINRNQKKQHWGHLAIFSCRILGQSTSSDLVLANHNQRIENTTFPANNSSTRSFIACSAKKKKGGGAGRNKYILIIYFLLLRIKGFQIDGSVTQD